MCGLISIHTENKNLTDSLFILDKMIGKIKHRGPDDEGKLMYQIKLYLVIED